MQAKQIRERLTTVLTRQRNAVQDLHDKVKSSRHLSNVSSHRTVPPPPPPLYKTETKKTATETIQKNKATRNSSPLDIILNGM